MTKPKWDVQQAQTSGDMNKIDFLVTLAPVKG